MKKIESDKKRIPARHSDPEDSIIFSLAFADSMLTKTAGKLRNETERMSGEQKN